LYEDPYAFRPERFVGVKQPDDPGAARKGEPGRRAGGRPGTYTWIPFGGGRRRCLGAAFAMLEMRVVLRSVLRERDLQPVDAAPALSRRRNITIRPGRGCRVRLPERSRAPEPVAVAA